MRMIKNGHIYFVNTLDIQKEYILFYTNYLYNVVSSKRVYIMTPIVRVFLRLFLISFNRCWIGSVSKR